MVSRELRKLSRRELMDIIYRMKRNEEQLQAEMDALRQQLQDKRLRLSQAGSIAEAAASITDMLSAAQNAADLYLQEIACMKEETEKEREKILEEANKAAEKILSDSENRYHELQSRYRNEYIKWQHLREEVKTLEEKRNCCLDGEGNHDEEIKEGN